MAGKKTAPDSELAGELVEGGADVTETEAAPEAEAPAMEPAPDEPAPDEPAPDEPAPDEPAPDDIEAAPEETPPASADDMVDMIAKEESDKLDDGVDMILSGVMRDGQEMPPPFGVALIVPEDGHDEDELITEGVTVSLRGNEVVRVPKSAVKWLAKHSVYVVKKA